MPLQLRRGLESDRTDITPAIGEPLYTTDTKNLYVGDGVTPGGVLVTSNLDEFASAEDNGLSIGPSVWWGVEKTLSTTSLSYIDAIDKTKYGSVRYQVQVVCGSSRHVSEIRIFHDGTNSYLTEYGAMYNNGPLATFSSDILSGNLRLLAQPSQSDPPTYFKMTAQAIKL